MVKMVGWDSPLPVLPLSKAIQVALVASVVPATAPCPRKPPPASQKSLGELFEVG